MNKCSWCAKFARWSNLKFVIEYDMDLGGNVTQTEYFEHKHDCPKPKKRGTSK